MGLFVKICGLTSAEDVHAVAALVPDALGFVFWPQSVRCVKPEEVAVWTHNLSPAILRVGVFVDTPYKEIAEIREHVGLDVVQLHGNENVEEYAELPCQIWKAIHMRKGKEKKVFGNRIDAFLIDSYSIESPGGTGRVCDWESAKHFVSARQTKVLLAGGLNGSNVDHAVDVVNPWGVDVSSGVESEPGHKDINKVQEFIERCRKH